MKTFYITTLGCKVNQYESDGIATELVAGGWQREEYAEQAQICIINTCAVTSRAATQSRQQIRSIIRSNPAAKIIVTGCHAQTAPDEIKKIEQVDIITGHQDKFNIARAILESEKEDKLCRDNKDILSSDLTFRSFTPAVTGNKTRAYLKIQDGCNSFCTYCIVPYARGRSRSMPVHEVIEHLEHLCSKGYMEAILTGIHVGAYGLDLEKRSSLTELMTKIDRIRPIHRIRLSSIEPKELSEQIINLASKSGFTNNMNIDKKSNSIKNRPILCDHFHIPLQSGDDTILKRMGRPYDGAFFEELIMKIDKSVPTAAIGVDILEGFPGESDQAFDNTLRLIEKLPVTYLHVFPFSPRKGTPAFGYPDKVDIKIVKKRCAILRKLGLLKKKAFENRLIGSTLESVIQDVADTNTGKLVAVTSNYLSVLVDGSDELKRQIVDIELTGRDKNNKLTGRIA